MNEWMPNRDLGGKVAIITGAGEGIGRAIAGSLVREHVRVILVGRTEEKLKRAAGELGQLATAQAVDLDLYPAGLKHVARSAVDLYGKLDIVVNNAAYLHPDRPLLQHYNDGTAVTRGWTLGIMGPLQLAHALEKDNRRRRTVGDIVNISSLAAVMPAPMQGAYAMFKAAMLSHTRTLAAEMTNLERKGRAASLRVFGVLPGITDTNMAKPIIKGPKADKIRVTLPNQRFNTAEDVAGAVLFCIKSGANGDILSVNGGQVATLHKF